MNTSEIRAALRVKFAAPEFGLIEEVRNGTGFGRITRTADALAMSLWPSRGLELHGFEIKASRSDWLVELKNPAKAEEIAKFCHRWWVVVGDSKIVKSGELPKNWGLIVPRGKALAIKVHAPEMDAKMVDYAFLAAIFRKLADNTITPEQYRLDVIKARREGQALGDVHFKRRVERSELDLKTLKEKVANFEKGSGINIGNAWRSEQVGESVKFVMDGGLKEVKRTMATLHNNATKLMELCDSGHKAIEEMENNE